MKRVTATTSHVWRILGVACVWIFGYASVALAQAPVNQLPSPKPPVHGVQSLVNRAVYQSVSPVTEGLQLIVVLPDVSDVSSAYFSASRPVYVEVSMVNTTDKPIHLLYPWPDIAARLNLIVSTADDEPVPLTAYGKGRYVVPDFNAPYILPAAQSYPVPDVPSHGSLEYRFLLSRIFDFSEANTYKVVAKQLIPTLDGKRRAVIQSNSLQFSVGTGTEPNLIPPFLTDPASP